MQIRSLDELDLEIAWQRVLWRVRSGRDVPDRLPFEVLDRVTAGSPRLESSHHLAPLHLVMATKKSGTARPFVRINPLDLMLYQALVDALAPAIEATLGGRDTVFAYRQDLTGNANPYHASPTWADFMASVRERLGANGARFSPFSFRRRESTYALTADVTSYFVYVDLPELERRLLSVTDRTAVVRDLGELLRAWSLLGVRGLPQGLAPSSALGNFYLARLDGVLTEWGVEFRRYMDDLWVFASSYSRARELQDAIERVLYEDGLGLGGGKSTIRRAETALRDTETAEELIEARREGLRELVALADAGYAVEDDVELDAEDIDEAAVHGEYDDLWDGVRRGRYPDKVRPRLIAVYRELEKARDPHAIEDVPAVLARLPDLMPDALRYLAASREPSHARAETAFVGLMQAGFHRDQEWLHICRATMLFRLRPSASIAHELAEVARHHANAFVRAKALLGWGAASEKDDFSVVDELWPTLGAEWRPYALASIQAKDEAERDARYDRWSGEARFLRSVADAIRDKLFSWRQL